MSESEVDTDYRPPGARAWSRLLAGMAYWVAGTLFVAALIWFFSWKVATWEQFQVSSKDDPETIVQVVSAVVIAIFVFAAGTSFVVAQVVPGTRGTRAVELLRTQHLTLTIAPALALTPLSCLVLPLSGRNAAALAAALLLGSVVYLVVATLALLHILGEATSPESYARLLSRQYRTSLRALDPTKTSNVGLARRDDNRWYRSAARRRRAMSEPAAVNLLYDTIRALRGWTRTAATTGDSRELHVSLETTLRLVHEYACVVRPCQVRKEVPANYQHNAETPETNPLHAEREPVDPSPDAREPAQHSPDDDALDLSLWLDWVPPSLPPKGTASTRQGLSIEDALGMIWVANEVGRSLVRATELGAASTALLERDRGRLLNTLSKAARRFSENEDVPSAGVMVAYLVELGLGARRCSPDQVLWHLEPLTVLVDLHQHFQKLDRADQLVVRIGIAAGVLKVAEAITAARLRTLKEQNTEPTSDQRSVNDESEAVNESTLDKAPTESAPDEAVAERTVRELRGAVEPYWPAWRLTLPDPDDRAKDPVLRSQLDVLVQQLAMSTNLEPRDQPRLYPPEGSLQELVFNKLSSKPPSLSRGAEQAPAVPTDGRGR